MHRRASRALFALVAAASFAIVGASAHADPVRCKAAIIKASSRFVAAEVKARRKCRERVVKGRLPPETDCRANLRTTRALAKARAKLETRIVKACGGRDRTCGTSDDDPLDSIGWDIGTCPNFEVGTCTNPIASCADIFTCLACIDDAAADHAIALDYDGFKITEPHTEKAARRCQIAIGRESAKFLVAKAKALARCWTAVDKGKVPGPCPDPGDGKAQAAIERAATKRTSAICKACGGADRTCGTPDDLTTDDIGFAPNCSLFGSCGRPVESLDDLVQCVDCDARLRVDCTDRSAAPAFAPTPRFLCNEMVITVTLDDELDYTKDPTHGTRDFFAAVTPDPTAVPATVGGPVDVSYLGGACTGFATMAPDLRIRFANPGPLLRIYFVGNGDSTMVVNDPFGDFYCTDDSFGTLNPTLDFNSPVGGVYDIWVGSFSEGVSVDGTLFVTGNSGNHP